MYEQVLKQEGGIWWDLLTQSVEERWQDELRIMERLDVLGEQECYARGVKMVRQKECRLLL